MKDTSRRVSYLISKFDKVPISITYNNKKMNSYLHGEIYFKVFLAEDGMPKLDIHFFNTIADSLKTTDGETGLLSFSLTEKTELNYNHKNGSLSGNFTVSLHYPLIDDKKGWKLSEPDNFIPYTETFNVKVNGRFHNPIKPGINRVESLTLSLDFVPAGEGVLKQITDIAMPDFNFYINWTVIKLCHATIRKLLVQPVFIRNNNQDPSPTGVAFNTLLSNANIVWQKCCIQFDALPPMYINNSSYRVITAAGNQTSAEESESLVR